MKTYWILLFLLAFRLAEATHIVGGEIYYDYLGGNNYRITMKVYRDCINGVPPFDDPAFMTIFRGDGTVFNTMNVPITSSLTVPPSNNSPCAPTTAGSACVEEAIYVTTVTLPPLNGGYYIAYQRCCRNGTILNLVNPGAVGATYWEHIPGPNQVAVNSSPRFTLRPPIYICKGVPIKFNHAATDPDGDSLVYSLCTPFNGLDQCCPVVGQPGCSATCPTVNTPPPYISVPFAPPYNSGYPMASSPAININPQTGFLNGSPTTLGQWVVGVCVSEYRNGILIGTHHRDFQFNVIPCPNMGVAGIIAQTTTNNGAGTGYCNGFTIAYQNSSQGNNTSYYWDFGDPTTTTDTSYSYNPTYTFGAIGVYTVTLVTNPGNPCADTTREVFHVYPLLSPSIITPTAQCLTGNSFQFGATGGFMGTGTYTWTFGAQATPSVATTTSVSNVHFNAPGSYSVTFIVSENGCTAADGDTIRVYPPTQATIGNFEAVGCDPYILTFPNVSSGTSMTYLWQFSDGTTSTDATPTHTFTPPGVYSLSLTAVSSQYCMDTSKVVSVNSVTVYPTPTAGFVATPTITTIFDPDIRFYNTTVVSENIVGWYYNFDDGGSSTEINPFHTYQTWGDFYATQTVTNAYGCPHTVKLLIRILPEFRFWVPNAFTPGKDGLNDIFKPVVIGVEEYNFMIFDRWGEQIYKTEDQTEGWDGRRKDNPCTDDVYIWKCDFKNVVSKAHEYHVGHVMLVR
jgi:gliding motility-associated-like protein